MLLESGKVFGKEVDGVKIVVVKSPKALRRILRRIFKLK